MFAGTVRQLCQPPVLAMAKLPIGAAVGLSRRASTGPGTPPDGPQGARARGRRPAVDPKSTLAKTAESPLAPPATSWPPPVSPHASTVRPVRWSADSAWIVPYASRVPVGGGEPVWVGVGVGVG